MLKIFQIFFLGVIILFSCERPPKTRLQIQAEYFKKYCTGNQLPVETCLDSLFSVAIRGIPIDSLVKKGGKATRIFIHQDGYVELIYEFNYLKVTVDTTTPCLRRSKMGIGSIRELGYYFLNDTLVKSGQMNW